MTESYSVQGTPTPEMPSKPAQTLSAPVARVHRLQRIFARLEEGATYSAIGDEEGVSGERVRQIIAAAVAAGVGKLAPLHRQMQVARLMPALRLARRGVAAGDMAAIRPMLAILDRLDRHAVTPARQPMSLIDPTAAGEAGEARLSGLDGSGVYQEYEAMVERKAAEREMEAAWNLPDKRKEPKGRQKSPR